MSNLDGIISQEIKKLPENERGSVSIERCIQIARITARRYAEELAKKELRTRDTALTTIDED